MVAALIAQKEDPSRFLVQQRPSGGSRALLWEFPGGKVEPGESDEAALARECREELGVELSVKERLWSTVHAYEDLTVELVLYRTSLVSGTPACLHANELRYVDPPAMRELPFCEADLPLIEFLVTSA